MTPAQTNDLIKWYDSIEEVRNDGFQLVPCHSPLQFYRLIGKKTVLEIDNFEPIPDLTYIVECQDKIQLKEFRGYSVKDFYFYRPYPHVLTFSGQQEAIGVLKEQIELAKVQLLFNENMIADMTKMLTRLYKSYFTDEGKLPYKTYLQLLSQSLDLEDWREYNASTIGYKTKIKVYEDNIRRLWLSAKK